MTTMTETMTKIGVSVQKLAADAVVPKYAHDGDAGVDLYSAINLNPPGERALSPRAEDGHPQRL